MSVITERLPRTFPEGEWATVFWADPTGRDHFQFVPRNKELINRSGLPVVNLEVDIESPYGHEGRANSLDLEVDIENPYGTEGRTAA